MQRPLSAITVRRESYHRLPRRVISEQIESRPVAPIDASAFHQSSLSRERIGT